MLPSYLLALREGLEAALIIGILVGTLKKIQRPNLRAPVWGGVVMAIFTSLLTAVILQWAGARLEGRSEQIFEGVTMLAAAGLLTWVIFWVNRQARQHQRSLESQVRFLSGRSGTVALFSLAFFAVAREGVELAVFLLAARAASEGAGIYLGAILGLISASILGLLVFTGSVRLALRPFFQSTNLLLMLFAAGLVAHGVHELNEAGWIPALIEPLWDISFLIPETTIVGQLLKALFGYNANPSLSEVFAYTGYYVALLLGLRLTFPSTTQEVVSG